MLIQTTVLLRFIKIAGFSYRPFIQSHKHKPYITRYTIMMKATFSISFLFSYQLLFLFVPYKTIENCVNTIFNTVCQVQPTYRSCFKCDPYFPCTLLRDVFNFTHLFFFNYCLFCLTHKYTFTYNIKNTIYFCNI